MTNVKVNAVGDQCPIPVVKATKALGEFKEAGTLEVQVDNEIAIQNLTRLADSKGLKSRSEKLGDNLFAITMEVNGPLTMGGEDLSCHTDNRGDFVVAIDTDAMGRGSDDLGRTLMKGFIYAVSQLETLYCSTTAAPSSLPRVPYRWRTSGAWKLRVCRYSPAAPALTSTALPINWR